MSNSKITISNPCNNDWSEMSSTENGRHCIACKKTVIDFTNWEIEEIQKYLNQKNETVCGHFKSLQVVVKRPRHHQYLVDAYIKTDNNLKSSYIKSFVLNTIMALMFLVGCNNPSKTKNQFDVKDSIETNENNGRTTGEIAAPRFQDTDSLSTKNTSSHEYTEKP